MAPTDPGDMPGLVASLPDTATVEAPPLVTSLLRGRVSAFVVGRGGRVGGTVVPDGRGGRVAGIPRVMRSGRSGRL